MDASASAAPMRALTITAVIDLARDIRSFELRDPQGAELPPFTPGAHLKVTTPGGALRKYSLCNDPAERDRYVITVKLESAGQGGSRSMHDSAQVGGSLLAAPPDNAFPLDADARGYLFIAGGIGITPIMAMIRSLGESPPVPWKLVYLTRSPADTAFLDELAAPAWSGRVVLHHDHGDPDQAFDLWPLLERPNAAHIYCCGPRGLMESVRDMAGHWPRAHLHFESFNEGGGVRPEDVPFAVRLAHSGARCEVPVGQTILGALRAQGLTLPSSCESGTCGTCRTVLLEGEADHRDMVLMPEEMAGQIMICVSRAKSTELVLDL